MPWRSFPGNLPNPDSLGCQAVDLPSEGEEEGLEFLESLGGPEDGIVANPDCPAACQFDSLPPAIPASRQVELAILSVFPFFEAYLRDDDAAEAFLKERLAAENPELSVEWVLSP
ncbi:MAG: hypothetical protein KatS3mg076_2430 [Candidatus Binatia bacterium]|nr:MAG: hypothetical protein KatS3mg076_2430 [Candidatus Binatia bacterium]